MKETKIRKYFLKRYPDKDIGFIMDRGFTDYELLLDFKNKASTTLWHLRRTLRFCPLK